MLVWKLLHAIVGKAGSRLLVLAVVARSYVDGPTSADTSGTSPRACAAPTAVCTSKGCVGNPLDDKTRTGNRNVVIDSHRVLSSASLTSNWAAVWTALASQQEQEPQ